MAQQSSCVTVNAAARLGSIDEVKRLIAEGHPVDVMDNRGWRPVHEAAAMNYTVCLQELLHEAETNVSWVNHEGSSALLLAAEQGHSTAAAILLKHGADPDQADSMQNTPLHMAVNSGNSHLVQLLVDNGATVNCQQYCGSSPLHFVASDGRLDMLSILLQAGARLDVFEEYHISPIFSAAQCGQHGCLKVLLDHAKGTNMVNSTDDEGGTPLYLAAKEGHVTCVEELLQHGADANLMTSKPKYLPLHAALQFPHIECVRLLLPHTDSDNFPKCVNNPFDFATSHSDPACLNCLIASGLNINYCHPLPDDEPVEPRILQIFTHSVSYSRNMHPLASLAIYDNPISNAEILLKAGARLNPYGYEFPPILVALDRYNLDYVKMLIKYGVELDVYHPCVVGNMALIVCLRYWIGFNLLLRCGADAKHNFDYKSDQTVHEGGLVAIDQDSNDSMEGSNAQSPSEQDAMSFYETVSGARYAMSRRTVSVGMVLYQMLQFVGSVRLDPRLESLMEHPGDWQMLRKFTDVPRPLMHLSRLAVRRAVGAKHLLEDSNLQSLPLPQTILSYLLYAELDPEEPPQWS